MCPCPYCRNASGPIPGCRCEMCRRALERSSINRNLAALSAFAVAGDVRGYGATPGFPFAPPQRMSNYGQRSGGCGCNGSR